MKGESAAAGGPVRIAQIMTGMGYDGVTEGVMNYYRHMDREKIQFDFLDQEGFAVPQREEIERLGGRIFVVPRYYHVPDFLKELEALYTRNHYQIVHSHMNTLSVLPLYAAKKAGVPNRIANSHSTAGPGEHLRNVIKYTLRPFAGIYPTQMCACTEHAGRWLFGKHADVHVFRSAIELDRFSFDKTARKELRQELGLKGRLVVGFVGRYCSQKNPFLLIDIFQGVVKRHPQSVLLAIGEGELLPKVKQKVHKLGLADHVKLLDPRLDVNRYYQAMDVLVLPSRYEGLGLVGIEAQAAGLPCVFSDGVPEETKILESTAFVKLDAPVDHWAAAVLQGVKKYPRRDTTLEMRKAGYDIRLEAWKQERFYLQLLTAGGKAAV